MDLSHCLKKTHTEMTNMNGQTKTMEKYDRKHVGQSQNQFVGRGLRELYV